MQKQGKTPRTPAQIPKMWFAIGPNPTRNSWRYLIFCSFTMASRKQTDKGSDEQEPGPSAQWDDDHIDLTLDDEDVEVSSIFDPTPTEISPDHLCASQNSPHSLALPKKSSKGKLTKSSSTSRLKSVVGYHTSGARCLDPPGQFEPISPPLPRRPDTPVTSRVNRQFRNRRFNQTPHHITYLRRSKRVTTRQQHKAVPYQYHTDLYCEQSQQFTVTKNTRGQTLSRAYTFSQVKTGHNMSTPKDNAASSATSKPVEARGRRDTPKPSSTASTGAAKPKVATQTKAKTPGKRPIASPGKPAHKEARIASTNEGNFSNMDLLPPEQSPRPPIEAWPDDDGSAAAAQHHVPAKLDECESEYFIRVHNFYVDDPKVKRLLWKVPANMQPLAARRPSMGVPDSSQERFLGHFTPPISTALFTTQAEINKEIRRRDAELNKNLHQVNQWPPVPDLGGAEITIFKPYKPFASPKYLYPLRAAGKVLNHTEDSYAYLNLTTGTSNYQPQCIVPGCIRFGQTYKNIDELFTHIQGHHLSPFRIVAMCGVQMYKQGLLVSCDAEFQSPSTLAHHLQASHGFQPRQVWNMIFLYRLDDWRWNHLIRWRVGLDREEGGQKFLLWTLPFIPAVMDESKSYLLMPRTITWWRFVAYLHCVQLDKAYFQNRVTIAEEPLHQGMLLPRPFAGFQANYNSQQNFCGSNIAWATVMNQPLTRTEYFDALGPDGINFIYTWIAVGTSGLKYYSYINPDVDPDRHVAEIDHFHYLPMPYQKEHRNMTPQAVARYYNKFTVREDEEMELVAGNEFYDAGTPERVALDRKQKKKDEMLKAVAKKGFRFKERRVPRPVTTPAESVDGDWSLRPTPHQIKIQKDWEANKKLSQSSAEEPVPSTKSTAMTVPKPAVTTLTRQIMTSQETDFSLHPEDQPTETWHPVEPPKPLHPGLPIPEKWHLDAEHKSILPSPSQPLTPVVSASATAIAVDPPRQVRLSLDDDIAAYKGPGADDKLKQHIKVRTASGGARPKEPAPPASPAIVEYPYFAPTPQEKWQREMRATGQLPTKDEALDALANQYLVEEAEKKKQQPSSLDYSAIDAQMARQAQSTPRDSPISASEFNSSMHVGQTIDEDPNQLYQQDFTIRGKKIMGVHLRVQAQEHAARHSVGGAIKNVNSKYDPRVLGRMEGTKAQLAHMIEYFEQGCSPRAIVSGYRLSEPVPVQNATYTWFRVCRRDDVNWTQNRTSEDWGPDVYNPPTDASWQFNRSTASQDSTLLLDDGKEVDRLSQTSPLGTDEDTRVESVSVVTTDAMPILEMTSQSAPSSHQGSAPSSPVRMQSPFQAPPVPKGRGITTALLLAQASDNSTPSDKRRVFKGRVTPPTFKKPKEPAYTSKSRATNVADLHRKQILRDLPQEYVDYTQSIDPVRREGNPINIPYPDVTKPWQPGDPARVRWEAVPSRLHYFPDFVLPSTPDNMGDLSCYNKEVQWLIRLLSKAAIQGYEAYEAIATLSIFNLQQDKEVNEQVVVENTSELEQLTEQNTTLDKLLRTERDTNVKWLEAYKALEKKLKDTEDVKESHLRESIRLKKKADQLDTQLTHANDLLAQGGSAAEFENLETKFHIKDGECQSLKEQKRTLAGKLQETQVACDKRCRVLDEHISSIEELYSISQSLYEDQKNHTHQLLQTTTDLRNKCIQMSDKLQRLQEANIPGVQQWLCEDSGVATSHGPVCFSIPSAPSSVADEQAPPIPPRPDLPSVPTRESSLGSLDSVFQPNDPQPTQTASAQSLTTHSSSLDLGASAFAFNTEAAIDTPLTDQQDDAIARWIRENRKSEEPRYPATFEEYIHWCRVRRIDVRITKEEYPAFIKAQTQPPDED